MKGKDDQGLNLHHTVQQWIYGEFEENAETRNLNGRLIAAFDNAGRVATSSFDIKGRPLDSARQFLSDYKNEPNWTDETVLNERLQNELLEEETFSTRQVFNVQGQPLRTLSPDGSIVENRYTQIGQLKAISAQHPEQDDAPTNAYVESIAYNAFGQPESIRYGNNVSTFFEHEETTLRLKRQIARSDSKTLQDLSYTYDPVGNLTAIMDDATPDIFNRNQQVKSRRNFSYDSLYRLRQADGRQHPGLLQTDYRTGGAPTLIDGSNPSQLEAYRETYDYDCSGNLTRLRHSAASASWTQDNLVSDTSNRAVLATDTQNGFDPNAFDAGGNQSLFDGRTFNWNYRNGLSAAVIVDRAKDGESDDCEHYVYDGGGRRVRKATETLQADGVIRIEEEVFYLGPLDIYRTRRKSGQGDAPDAVLINERHSLRIGDSIITDRTNVGQETENRTYRCCCATTKVHQHWNWMRQQN